MVDGIGREDPRRSFSVHVSPSEKVFVILETPDGALTRAEAWDKAQTQFLPVVFVSKKLRQESLGRRFNPAMFEKAIYEVWFDRSESNLDFEQWLRFFRGAPGQFMDGVPDYLRRSLGAYRNQLNAVRARMTS